MVQEKLINLPLNPLQTLSTTSFGIPKPAPEKSFDQTAENEHSEWGHRAITNATQSPKQHE